MTPVDRNLLWRLLQSPDPVPNVSPQQTHALRNAGCKLESHPAHGVRLLEAGLGVWADLLETVAPQAIVYGRTASTQDIARQLFEARGSRADGLVVAAHEQTHGRGRLGRTWSAPPGSAATFSRVCILNPSPPGGEAQRGAQDHDQPSPDPSPGGRGIAAPTTDRVTLAASIAVARAIEPLLGRPVHIKWPNDVWVEGRKIAGILVETSQAKGATAAIVGIGINVAMTADQLPVDNATSFAVLGVGADRLLVMAQAVEQLAIALSAEPDELLDEWRRRSLLLHHDAEFQHDNRTVRGQVVDLDPIDGLIVQTSDGTLIHLPSATTTVLR